MGKKMSSAWRMMLGEEPVSPTLDKNLLPEERTPLGGDPKDFVNKPIRTTRDEHLTTTKADKWLLGQPVPFYSEEYTKGDVQSGFGQLWRGAISRGLSVIPKTGQMAAHVGGALYYLNELTNPGLVGQADPSVIWDNGMVDMFSNMDEGLKELLPVHSTKQYAEGNLLEQMGTMKFWSEDMFDAVAFSAAAYGSGVAFGTIAKSLGLTRTIIQGGQAVKTLSKAGGVFRNIATATYNTIGEAGYEAYDVNKVIRDDLSYHNFDIAYKHLSKDEKLIIDKEAGVHAANTFKANVGILAGPNLIQSRLFFGPSGNKSAAIRKLVRKGAVKAEDLKVWKGILGKGLAGVASEGPWEEGMQFAVQKYNERVAKGDADDNWLIGYMTQYVDNLTVTEGQKAIFLGSFVGGMYGTRAGYMEHIQKVEQVSTEEGILNLLIAQLKLSDVNYISNVKTPLKTFIKKTEEDDDDGKTIVVEDVVHVNDQGEIEYDMEKLLKLALQQIGDKRLIDEKLNSFLNNDEFHGRVVDYEALARRAYEYYTAQGIDSKKEALDLLISRELELTEDEQNIGIEKTVPKELAKIFMDLLELTDNIVEGIEETKDKQRANFNSQVKKAVYMNKVRAEAYKDGLGDVNEEAAVEVQKLIEDAEKSVERLYNSKTREKLFKIWKSEVDLGSDLARQMTEEIESENPNASKIERLDYELEQHNTIEGTIPTNSIFAVIANEHARLEKLGMRNKYFYDNAALTLKTKRLAELIDQANKGNISFKEVVNYAMNEKSELTQEEDQAFKDLLDKQKREVDKMKEDYNKENEDVYDELTKKRLGEDAARLLSGKEVRPDEQELSDRLQNLEKLERQVERAESLFYGNEKHYNSIKASGDIKIGGKQKSEFSSDLAENRKFKRDFADMPIRSGEAIESNYKSNPENYDKVDDVEAAINKLKRNKRVLSSKENSRLLKSKQFDGYIESVDDMIARLEALHKSAIKNKNEKAGQDQRFQDNTNKIAFISIGVEFDLKTGKFEIVDKELYKEVQNAYGVSELEVLLNKAKKAKIGDRSAAFHNVFVEHILDTIKTSDKKKEFISFIESGLDDRVKEFTDIFTSLKQFANIPLYKKALQNIAKFYAMNPVKSFEEVVRNIAGIRQSETAVPIDNYFNDKDLLRLNDDLKDTEDTGYSGVNREDLLVLISMQLTIESLGRSIETLTSGYSLADQIKTETELVDSEAISPSNQQVEALRQVNKWFLTSFQKSKQFRGWVYLKGLAGTGKTTLSKRILNSLGLKKNEYIAVSHGQEQLNTLQDIIKASHDGLLLDKVSPETIPESIRLIVIDEVGNMNEKQLRRVADMLVEINKLRKTNPVRIMAMGDPSQVSETVGLHPEINDPMGGKIFIHEVQPLTIQFRSNIGPVLDIQNLFQGNFRKILKYVVKANAILGLKATGVHVGYDSNTLLRQLKVHANNNRTKLIIVGNERDKAKYAEVEGVDVLTYIEAQGIERDEVYVDISNEEFVGKVGEHGSYNKVLYTATSRAKQYIFFMDYTGTFKQETNELIKYDQKAIDEKLQKSKIEYTERLAFEAEVLGDKYKGAKPKVGANAEINDDNVQDYEETDNLSSEPTDAENVEPKSGVFEKITKLASRIHELMFPSYYAINYYTKEEFVTPVRIVNVKGEDVFPRVKYIRVYNDDQSRPEIWIVAEELNNSGVQVAGKNWHKIGVVGLEDLETNEFIASLHTKMLLDAQGAKVKYNDLVNNKLTFEEGETILATGYMKGAKPLTYNYKMTPTYTGVGLFIHLANIFNRGYMKRRNQKISMSVRIFSKKGKYNEYNGQLIQNTKLKVGIPYLIIETFGEKAEGEGKAVTQFIRLEPRKLRDTDPGISNILDFITSMKAIEAIGYGKYGEDKFNAFIKRFRLNYTIDENRNVIPTDDPVWTYDNYKNDKNKKYLPKVTKKQFDATRKHIDVVIKGFYGYGRDRVTFASEEDMRSEKDEYGKLKYRDTKRIKYRFDPGDRTDGRGYVKVLDDSDLEKKEKFIYIQKLTASKGQAQMALHVLSRANKIFDEYGVSVRYKGSSFAKSLLAEEDSFGEYYVALENIFNDLAPDELKGKFKMVEFNENSYKEIENLLVENGLAERELLDKLREDHRASKYTIETLSKIMSFDESGEHKDFWLPLDMDTVNELGENIDLANPDANLEDMLATTIESIEQTRIQVEMDETAKMVRAKRKKATKDAVKKVADKISSNFSNGRKRRSLTKDADTELGPRISIEQARKYAKKLMPGIGESELNFLDRISMLVKTGSNDWGVYKDGIIYIESNEDGTVHQNILRHEVFHKIYNEFLNDKERNVLSNALTVEFPDIAEKDNIDFEEELAVKYQEWKRKRISVKNNLVRKFFNLLSEWFGFVNRNTSSLDLFFENIERGYFASPIENGLGIERKLKDIKKVYGSLEEYMNIRNGIEDVYARIMKEGYNGLPIVRREVYKILVSELQIAKDEIYRRIRETVNNEGTEVAKKKHKVDFEDMSQLVTVLDTNSKGQFYVLNLLLEDIYPSMNLKSADILSPEVPLTDEEIFEMAQSLEDGAIGKHTVDSSRINRESKLSESVKDFLANIPIGDIIMNWREAYIRALQLLHGLDSGAKNFVDQLKDSWRYNGSNRRTSAVMNHILNLYKQAGTRKYIREGELQGILLPLNIKFVSEDDIIYGPKFIRDDVKGIGTAERDKLTIISRQKRESTHSFLTRAAQKLDQDPRVLGELLNKYIAINTLREFNTQFGSQKEMHIRIAERIEGTEARQRGMYKMTYIVGKFLGMSNSVSADVSVAFRDKFNKMYKYKSYMDKRWKELKKDYKEPAMFLKEFLNDLGLSNYVKDIPERHSGLAMEDIIEFMEGHAPGLINDTDGMAVALDKEGGSMVAHISQIIIFNNEYTRATSIRDVERKQKYIWHNASQAYFTLFKVMNSIGRKAMKSLSLPAYLSTDFFKENAFVNGLNRIYDIITHDGLREQRTAREYAVPYKKETRQDFLSRIFTHAFLANINSSPKKSPHYTQFFYTISDRPEMQGAEIGLLSPSEIRTGVLSILKQLSMDPLKGNELLNTYDKTSLNNLNVIKRILAGRDIVKNPIDFKKEGEMLAKQIEDELVNVARTFAEELIRNDVSLDMDLSNLTKISPFVDKRFSKSWRITDLANYGSRVRSRETGAQAKEAGRVRRKYAYTEEDLIPLTYMFVSNNYVNSYFLNQLVTGDFAQFKNSSVLLKRMSLIFAPGLKGFVHNTLGMKKKARIMVIEDPIRDKSDIIGFLKKMTGRDNVSELERKFAETFMPGDAQGFITPERFEDIKAGFGTSMGLINTIKAAIYDINENGIARGIKYSSIVLSNELVDKFPMLGVLRENMRRNGVDEAVFDSAVKVGGPANLISFDNVIKSDMKVEEGESYIFDIDNSNYRIQLNPKSDIDSDVANPTQLGYFMNILEGNEVEASNIYNALAFLMGRNMLEFSELTKNRSLLKTRLLNMFNVKGQERVYELLSEGLSINFPAIAEKAITQLSASMSKNIVRIKFKGSHLVLQSSLGIRKKDGSELEYKVDKKGNMYAEIILPRGLLPREIEREIENAFRNKTDIESAYEYQDLLGFRTPSSELHSAVPLKVVGFYDSQGTNVIIAPEMLVPLHGSDFDIDELYVIRRELDKEDKPVGYKYDAKSKKWIFDPKNVPVGKETREKFYRNTVVESFLKAITSEKNRDRMLSPISFVTLNEDIARIEEERGERLIIEEYDLSDPLGNLQSFQDTFGGVSAVGIFANAIKAFAYMSKSSSNNSIPKIKITKDKEGNEKPAVSIIIDGKSYNTVSDNISFWENMDSLLNAAIDNIKERILPKLNINTNTINTYTTLLGMGVPLSVANDIMLQPIIKEVGQLQRATDYQLKVFIDVIHRRLNDAGVESIELEELTSKMLSKGIKELRPFYKIIEKSKLSDNDISFLKEQLSVFNTFLNARALGDDVTKLSMFLSIIRSFPIDKHRIDDLLSDAKQMFGTKLDSNGIPEDMDSNDSGFKLDIAKFFESNPHVWQAYKSLKLLNEIVESNFMKHYRSLYDFIGKVEKKVKVNLAYRAGERKSMLREQFIRYFLSGYEAFENIKPYRYDKKGQPSYLTGAKAFSAHFIDMVKSAKKLDAFKNNRFLTSLTADFNANAKIFILNFNGGTNLNTMDILSLQDAFKELANVSTWYDSKTNKYKAVINKDAAGEDGYSQFQKDFVRFGILHNGLSFGVQGYTIILPTQLYREVDKNFVNKLNGLLSKANTDKLDALSDHFAIELAVNYAELVPEMRNIFDDKVEAVVLDTDKEGKKVRRGEEGGYIFDRKFENNVEGRSFPLIYKEGSFESADIYVRLNDGEDEVIYYQKVGPKNIINIYNLNENILNNGYKIEDHFSKKIRNIPVANRKNNSFAYKGEWPKVGTVVTLTDYHDTTRINRRFVKVIAHTSNGFTVQTVSADFEANLAQEEITDNVKKILTQKNSPIRMSKGKMIVKKDQLNEARLLYHGMNDARFYGRRVLYESTTPLGIQIFIDNNELHDLYYGKQETIDFNTENSDPVKVADNKRKQLIGERRQLYTSSPSVLDHLKIIRERLTPELRDILDSIMPTLKKYGSDLTIEFSETGKKNVPAKFQFYDRNIVVDLSNIGPTETLNEALAAYDIYILHEAVHAATVFSYLKDAEFQSKINSLYAFTLNRLKGDSNLLDRELKDPVEFIAYGMSNRAFREKLSDLNYTEGMTVLKRFWNWIKGLFRMNNTVLRELERLIDSYDLEVATSFEQILHEQETNPIFQKSLEFIDSLGEFNIEVIEDEVGTEEDTDELRKKGEALIKKILEESSNLEVNTNEDGTQGKAYIHAVTKEIWSRISTELENFTARKYNKEQTYGEKLADRMWKDKEPETKLRIDADLETKKEFQERMDQYMTEGRAKGIIIHKIIERKIDYLFNGGKNQDKIADEIRDISSVANVSPFAYIWVEENLEKFIFPNAGINVFLKDIQPHLRDKIYSEVTVASSLLGWAGTIDLLVMHSDSTFSIKEWKTGKRFGERIFSELMKFGSQEIPITDNQRERAKLQIMLYAFILKLENPDMQFRELSAVWIPNAYYAKNKDLFMNVEVSSYLTMLEQFFKDKKAVAEAGLPVDIYDQLIKKSSKLFMVSEYNVSYTDTLVDEIILSQVPPEKLLENKYAQLQLLSTKYVDFKDLTSAEKKKGRALVEEILLMESDPSLQFAISRDYEIGTFIEYFGNYADITNPHVQAWIKVRHRRREMARREHEKKFDIFQKLLEPVKKEYMKGRFSIKALGIEDINYPELFEFVFKEEEIEGFTIELLVQKGDEKYKTLTNAQKKLLDYMNTTLESYFVGPDAYMNQITGEKFDRKQSKFRTYKNIEMVNYDKEYLKSFVFRKGFFPKIAMTSEEMRWRAGNKSNIIGAFTPSYWKKELRNHLTFWQEENYSAYPYEQSAMTEALPVQFLGSVSMEHSREYSHNMEFAFDSFVRGMEYNKHMDSVFATGKALHHWLEWQTDENDQPMFKNTANFLEKKGLIGDILNRKIRLKWTRTDLTLGGSRVSIDKIIIAMMRWVSSTVMWLRPLQGTGNGIHAKMLTYRESIKGSFASKFLNIEGDAIDFKVADNAWADKVYFTTFIPDVLQGKMRQNKLWLLSKHIDYMPDNFDYATNKRILLSTRNKLIDESSMYTFHAKPEEYVSLTTMAAQLRYLKNPKTGKSLWDSYRVIQDKETGVYRLDWIGGVRGKVKRGRGQYARYEDITDLTAEEISKMKRVHERMQGGYRKEEMALIEIYVLGKSFIQLKKYLPRLIINTYHSKRFEPDLGNWRKMGERKDNEDVYEWVARMNEGRWRTTLNAFVTLGTFNKRNRDYRWGNLSSEQKQNVVDSIVNLGMWAMFYSAYLLLFADEDDDDTLKKWWKMYLLDNLTQQYNPYDLLRTLKSASSPVALGRSWKMAQSMMMMMGASVDLMRGDEDSAFTDEDVIKGWKEFQRGIPGLASYHDFLSKVKHSKSVSTDFLEELQNKWR